MHEQGQGPGFASDASIRGFSSDHSTDIALWIDGVPVNEPVNGHAEGYNDWSLLMPQAVSSMEVLKGPTSAVYGNFAMAGVVNVLTRERMSGQEFAVDGGANGRADGTFFTGIDRPGTGLVIGLRGMRDGGWRPNSEQHLGQFYGRLVQQLSSIGDARCRNAALRRRLEFAGIPLGRPVRRRRVRQRLRPDRWRLQAPRARARVAPRGAHAESRVAHHDVRDAGKLELLPHGAAGAG